MRSKALVGTVEDRDTTDQDAPDVPRAERAGGAAVESNYHYDVIETRAPVRRASHRVASYLSYPISYPILSCSVQPQVYIYILQ